MGGAKIGYFGVLFFTTHDPETTSIGSSMAVEHGAEIQSICEQLDLRIYVCMHLIYSPTNSNKMQIKCL